MAATCVIPSNVVSSYIAAAPAQISMMRGTDSTAADDVQGP